MKRILVCLSFIIVMISCENDDTKNKDLNFQSVYFPVQNPVKTIVLEDEIRIDISSGIVQEFTIAANIGGIVDNKENRTLQIRLAPELVPTDPFKLLITNSAVPDTLAILPAIYYKASSLSEIVIPSGKFDGKIRIDLNDDFFNDPNAVKLKYVIPLIIEKAKDSILKGKPVVDRNIARRTNNADWQIGKQPKDYVLFAVNYTNKYHGNYFHYGVDEVFKGAVFSKRTVYSKKPNIEMNAVTTAATTSLSETIINRLGGVNIGGVFQMKLKFNSDKSITVGSVKGAITNVSGSGNFVEAEEGIAWGGTKRKTMFLKYEFKDAIGDIHKCTDTLVYRNGAKVYSEFTLK